MTIAEALSIALRYFGCDATLPLTDRLAMWMAEQMVSHGHAIRIEGAFGATPRWLCCIIGANSAPTMRDAIVLAIAEWIQTQEPATKQAP